MSIVDPPELIPNDRLASRLNRGDRVRITFTDNDLEHTIETDWGGYSPNHFAYTSARGEPIFVLEDSAGEHEVRLIKRYERPWPDGGTPILVTEAHDELGEAGLPATPFIAITSGDQFFASRDGAWVDVWHKCFAAAWRELSIDPHGPRDGVEPYVEVLP